MGDFRVSFKASFEMGDVKDECDMWLNYSPREGVIDHRVSEWLEKNFRAGEESISNALYDADVERQERDKREREDKILLQADKIRAERDA